MQVRALTRRSLAGSIGDVRPGSSGGATAPCGALLTAGDGVPIEVSERGTECLLAAKMTVGGCPVEPSAAGQVTILVTAAATHKRTTDYGFRTLAYLEIDENTSDFIERW